MAWSLKSRQSRGYGNFWEKLRARVLQRDCHLCQCDQCEGGQVRVMLATEVHHVVSKAEAARKGWTQAQIDDLSNLSARSRECHLRDDAKAQGRALNHKTGFDLAGQPTDPSHPWFR